MLPRSRTTLILTNTLSHTHALQVPVIFYLYLYFFHFISNLTLLDTLSKNTPLFASFSKTDVSSKERLRPHSQNLLDNSRPLLALAY
jgi:hypothetical protein